MTTGEKIAKCRKDNGLTQEQLAEKLDVTRQAVSRWEGDLAFPETDTLMKMSRLFNVSCDYLLNYDNQQPSDAGRHKSIFNFDLEEFAFEYISKAHIGKLPLVHINIGFGRVAKGVFSVGLVSVGVVSVGLVNLGIVTFGLLCLGMLSFAALSGGVIALGGVAVGVIALGGLSIGVLSIGGCAIGAFACGGYANGSFVAIGDVVRGGIAIGDSRANGSVISVLKSNYRVMQTELDNKFAEIPKFWSGLSALMRRFADFFMLN